MIQRRTLVAEASSGMRRDGTVELLQHNPGWYNAYLHEAGCISRIVPPEQLELHHIGSTSIPGLIAKPIIDVLGIWHSPIELFDFYQEPFETNGYLWRGENSIGGRRFLLRPDPGLQVTHSHLHVFNFKHPEVTRHLAFRDYLKVHPDVAEQYAHLKLALLERFRHDRESYTAGKNDFIRDVLALAMADS